MGPGFTVDASNGVTSAVMIAVVVIAFVVIVIGGVRYSRAERERLARVRAMVESRGWTFTPRDDSLAERLTTRPFGGGDEREASEIITGTREGRPFQAFRYVIIDHSRDSKGRRTTTHTEHHVVWIPLARALPVLRLSPDDGLQRLLTGLGWGDVDTESHAFNQRWRVSARDDAYAHAVLAPHVIEELLRREWWGATLVIEGAVLALVRTGRPDLSTLDASLDRLEALAGLIPPFVLADYGS